MIWHMFDMWSRMIPDNKKKKKKRRNTEKIANFGKRKTGRRNGTTRKDGKY